MAHTLPLANITDPAALRSNSFATVTGDFDPSTFNSLTIHSQQVSSLDEIRFGDSAADVVVSPVPEPSSFALLAGCFGLAWIMVRRR